MNSTSRAEVPAASPTTMPVAPVAAPAAMQVTTAVATANPLDDWVTLDQGGYRTRPAQQGERLPPALVNPPAQGGPVPGNQWYSSLFFAKWPQPLYALPLSYQPQPHGFELGLPTRRVSLNPARDETDILYRHDAALTVTAQAFAFQQVRASKISDFGLQLAMGDGVDTLTVALTRGNPFSYYQLSRGDAVIKTDGAHQIFYRSDDGRALGVTVQGHSYAIFLPEGGQYHTSAPEQLRLQLPVQKRYFSIAALPDAVDQPDMVGSQVAGLNMAGAPEAGAPLAGKQRAQQVATLRQFARHAYAFITDTRVSWQVDAANSEVITTFKVSTEIKEGPDHGVLFGLLPHHWHQPPAISQQPRVNQPPFLAQQFDSVRGPIKLLAGQQFSTRTRYPGLLPFWSGLERSGLARPGLESSSLSRPSPAKASMASPEADTTQQAKHRRAQPNHVSPILPAADPVVSDPAKQLQHWLEQDLQGGAEAVLTPAGSGGSYWQGKALNKAVQLMAIAEQQGDRPKRDALLQAIKARLQQWLQHAQPERHSQYFYYDASIGTLIGYPDEFGSASELNDHHFHYGYWIFAAAQVALREPDWAKQWGGMVELLIADIANSRRENKKFAYLRHFDLYEGHSWASGTVPFFDGNNQESSSEAINAWAGIILWGEATGNPALRDSGIFLYSTEISALNHYWFDLQQLVFAPPYRNLDASMVWGSKYTHGTWFSDNPRQIHGINMLPITSASLYLGQDPDYVQRNFAAMEREYAKFVGNGAKSHGAPDLWQDILLQYLALAQPQAALAQWHPLGAVEEGESTSHTFHWLHSLLRLGRPDFSIHANTALYAVFRNGAGQRVYLAYNASPITQNVRFSDGVVLQVLAGQLAEFSK